MFLTIRRSSLTPGIVKLGTCLLIAALSLGGCNNGSGLAQPDTSGFTISGTVTGLTQTGLILQLNGAHDLAQSGSSFTFPTGLPYKTSYAVSILSQPTGENCTVNNGTGTNIQANVTDVMVVCSAASYSVSGSVTGLGSSLQVVLLDNGIDPVTVTSNSGFTFSTKLAYGAAYDISVGTQPTGQYCALTNGTGSQISAPVTNVTASCLDIYSTLYSFNSGVDAQAVGAGAIVLGPDGDFYGVGGAGGTYGSGAVFAITPAGAENVIYSFNSASPANGYGPGGIVTVGPDGDLYGSTVDGGSASCGVVFKMTRSGTGYTVLHSFLGGADGCQLRSPPVFDSTGNLYGTTVTGTSGTNGTAFTISSTGVYQVLYTFGSGTDVKNVFIPMMIASDGNLYGMGFSGGQFGAGGIFQLTTAGVEQVIYSFTGGTDGREPASTLLEGSDGFLYGTTYSGGASSVGTAFKLSKTGTFTLLHTFAGAPSDGANSDRNPLVQGPDGFIYGTTMNGGSASDGVLYRMSTSGQITILHNFQGGTSDGAHPIGGVTFGTDGNLYGTCVGGGANSEGTFFRYLYQSLQ